MLVIAVVHMLFSLVRLHPFITSFGYHKNLSSVKRCPCELQPYSSDSCIIKVLPSSSGRQPKTMAVTCIVLGVSYFPLNSNSTEFAPRPTSVLFSILQKLFVLKNLSILTACLLISHFLLSQLDSLPLPKSFESLTVVLHGVKLSSHG